MKTRTPIVAGNWKMHKTLAEARDLVAGILAGISKNTGSNLVETVICPPFHLLFPMAKAVAASNLKLGAQNSHEADFGAFTGEVSVPMIKETGCTYVIIGHSERRLIFGELGAQLAKKVRSVVHAELSVIFCVGETLSERDAGTTQRVIRRQIEDALSAEVPVNRLIVAYEPVWAIGTGKTATPQQAQEVHAAIRGQLALIYGAEQAETIRILYGGSVKPGNAAELVAQPDIDGMLVGGASLVAEDFVGIIQAVAANY